MSFPRHCLDCREDGSTHGVLLCPLHQATPEMVEMITRIVRAFDGDEGMGPEYVAAIRALLARMGRVT